MPLLHTLVIVISLLVYGRGVLKSFLHALSASLVSLVTIITKEPFIEQLRSLSTMSVELNISVFSASRLITGIFEQPNNLSSISDSSL